MKTLAKVWTCWQESFFVLCRNPLLLVLQLFAVCLAIGIRRFELDYVTNLSPLGMFLIFLTFYIVNAYCAYYVMEFMSTPSVIAKRVGYKVVTCAKQLLLYFLLFIAPLFFFYYTPQAYGKKFFFLALTPQESLPYSLSIKLAFCLLVLGLVYLFMVQHLALVMLAAGYRGYKEIGHKALYVLHNNLGVCISLTLCTAIIDLLVTLLLRMYIGSSLWLGYYSLVFVLTLYVISLTIFYHKKYIKHEYV